MGIHLLPGTRGQPRKHFLLADGDGNRVRARVRLPSWALNSGRGSPRKSGNLPLSFHICCCSVRSSGDHELQLLCPGARPSVGFIPSFCLSFGLGVFMPCVCVCAHVCVHTCMCKREITDETERDRFMVRDRDRQIGRPCGRDRKGTRAFDTSAGAWPQLPSASRLPSLLPTGSQPCSLRNGIWEEERGSPPGLVPQIWLGKPRVIFSL